MKSTAKQKYLKKNNTRMECQVRVIKIYRKYYERN